MKKKKKIKIKKERKKTKKHIYTRTNNRDPEKTNYTNNIDEPQAKSVHVIKETDDRIIRLQKDINVLYYIYL